MTPYCLRCNLRDGLRVKLTPMPVEHPHMYVCAYCGDETDVAGWQDAYEAQQRTLLDHYDRIDLERKLRFFDTGSSFGRVDGMEIPRRRKRS